MAHTAELRRDPPAREPDRDRGHDQGHDRIGRIGRMRLRYQGGPAFISIQRALHYTESWRETEGRGIPRAVRVALAMRRVYERMDHHLDPDERIAGSWTEHFLGMPVDIERGIFGEVLAAELSKPTMAAQRGAALARGLAYAVRSRGLGDLVRGQIIARRRGAPPLNLGLRTMQEREVNPFQITDADRRLLVGELLPYWRGRTLVDELQRRLVASGLFSSAWHDLVAALGGGTSRQVLMVGAAASVACIQGHVILDYAPVLAKGLRGMLADVRAARDGAAATEIGDGERAFLDSVELALEGVGIFATRLADRVALELRGRLAAARRAELEELLAVCRHVPRERPRTFREAVQALWTVKTAVELAHPVNLHCFGRLDQMLEPFYAADLAAGRTTPEAARELLEELLLKIMSQNMRPESNMLAHFYHRFLGSSPVTLGGVRPADGTDATCATTYLFLDAAARSKAVTNVSLRVHPATPAALLDRVAQILAGEGASNLSLFNDATHVEAMRRRGFSLEDARDYAVMGCVETTCPGRTGHMSASALLLSRVLDMTLRDGEAAMLAGKVRGEGLRTGDPDRFGTFEELVTAFEEQARHAVGKIAAASDLRDLAHAEHLPAPLVSAFMDGCLDARRDVTRGGARYHMTGVSLINSIANATDSLHVIRRLVFEERRCTIRELMAAVDADFVGHEALLEHIRAVPGKWGNGDPATDELARRVVQALCDEVHRHRTPHGGPFVVYAISMTTHTIDGRLSVATPDGRHAATPFAASCNPYNVERRGPTAALRSVAALPFEEVMGCAVNMRFHPSALGPSAAARAKWVALLRAYFALGGAQLQPTVASAETLRAAQRDPDAYRDLVVKVGGYSTYFVDLGREIQAEVIARTEHA